MVAKKRPPGLSPWPPSSHHVLRHGGLRDLNAELQQLPMNARGAPERVDQADLSDQIAQVFGDLRPPRAAATPPPPVGAEALPMPADDRLGTQDSDRTQQSRPQPVKPYEEQPVTRSNAPGDRRPGTLS